MLCIQKIYISGKLACIKIDFEDLWRLWYPQWNEFEPLNCIKQCSWLPSDLETVSLLTSLWHFSHASGQWETPGEVGSVGGQLTWSSLLAESLDPFSKVLFVFEFGTHCCHHCSGFRSLNRRWEVQSEVNKILYDTMILYVYYIYISI